MSPLLKEFMELLRDLNWSLLMYHPIAETQCAKLAEWLTQNPIILEEMPGIYPLTWEYLQAKYPLN